MKEQETEVRDIIQVELTGTIKNLPDFCRYIPRPLIRFGLDSFRKKKEGQEEVVADDNIIIVFDDEKFHLDYQNGMRIRVKGELQSRNYYREVEGIDELIVIAAKNYVEIWKKYPAKTPPKGKRKVLIDWDALLEVALIPGVPEDSLFQAGGVKGDGEYVYKIDENGDVYKETQHTAYEVVATEYEVIHEPLAEEKGDINKVIIEGDVTRQPRFDYVGSDSKVAFCGFGVGTNSTYFEGRRFYNNVISWGNIAEKAFSSLQKGTRVRVIGRLQSRVYEKELTKRWKTPSGKSKKKKTNILLTAREVSARKIEVLTENERDEGY